MKLFLLGSISVRWTHWHRKGSNGVKGLRHVASLLASLCKIMSFGYMRLLSCSERDIRVPSALYYDPKSPSGLFLI